MCVYLGSQAKEERKLSTVNVEVYNGVDSRQPFFMFIGTDVVIRRRRHNILGGNLPM